MANKCNTDELYEKWRATQRQKARIPLPDDHWCNKSYSVTFNSFPEYMTFDLLYEKFRTMEEALGLERSIA